MIELIIVMETRASNESDWKYIKSALDYYYKPRTYGITKIFAKCKPELMKQDKRIEQAVKNAAPRKPVVVVCADYDRSTDESNNDIIDYCKSNEFYLVWMNLDIEDVFWGEQIDDKYKSEKSNSFQRKKDKLLANVCGLNETNPLKKRHKSNLLVICDKFLARK